MSSWLPDMDEAELRELSAMADEAIKRMNKRAQTETIKQWAKRLASCLAKFTD